MTVSEFCRGSLLIFTTFSDSTMVEKITKSLSLNLPAHILRSRDPKAILSALFSAWIPLSTAVLVSVIEHLPSPATAQEARTSDLIDASPGGSSVDGKIRTAMRTLKNTTDDPTVAFVSKMVAVPAKDLPQNKNRSGAALTTDEARELNRKKRAEIARAQAAANGEHPDVAELRESLNGVGLSKDSAEEPAGPDEEEKEEEEHLIGFARLFSGSLKVGDEIYVLPPKFTPVNPHTSPEPQKVTITALYLLMGKELDSLTSVPPGVVFGIGGLEGHIMKSGTLCSQIEGGVNLAGVSMGGEPIVRVALEPENPLDLDKMIVGMRLLEQSDPCARYEVLENGEHVILTAGELHLERCLKDLRERFARCEVQVGAPIVPYRESIVSAAEMNPPKSKDLPRGTVLSSESLATLKLRLRVVPLPEAAVEFLEENFALIREQYEEGAGEEGQNATTDVSDEQSDESRIESTTPAHGTRVLTSIRDGLSKIFAETKGERDLFKSAAQDIVAFGPRRVGPNILVDKTDDRFCRAR